MSGWLKLAGILIVTTVLNLLGFQITGLYNRRILFWEQMMKMSEYFLTEIRFTADSPEKILDRLCLTHGYSNWNLPKEGVPFALGFSKQAKRLVRQLGLEGDFQSIDAFGRGLGTTDLEGQLRHCTVFGRVFAEKAAVAKEEYRTKGKLYRSFCLLASVAAAIMLL